MHDILKIKSYSRIIGVAVIAVALCLGCIKEEERYGAGATTTCLRAESTDMLPQYTAPDESELCALTPKTAEEKEIRTLHLFFFDKDGNFLQPNPEHADFNPYQKIDGSFCPIPERAFLGDLTDVHIYAVANIFGGKFKTPYSTDGDIRTGSQNGPVIEINKASDLDSWIYAPVPRSGNTNISDLPEPGMPMTGTLSGVNLANTSAGAITIPMKAMMARIDITIRLDAAQTSHDHRLPQLTLLEYGVKNMPSTVPFTQPADDAATDVSEGKIRDMTVSLQPQTILHDGDPAATFSYYTYENIQQKIATPHYPEGVTTDEEKQRWKPTIANKDAASALTIKGSYITHQGLTYTAYFTIYMGLNTVDDFKVKRNRCYKNNITIRGLDYVRNDNDAVYTFDGRVNVSTENPIYISIVNERKVDAHASVLPMDVYFLRRESGITDLESTVTVSLKDAAGNAPDWIRMEKVDSATMARGGFRAGTGARDYFTTDLVTNTLKDNTQLVLEGAKDRSRSRVYFYIDENITRNSNGDVPDRSANVYITYRNKLGEMFERVLQIDQRGLLHVTGTQNGAVDIYIEYYEEYVAHADPLDKHSMPAELYEGLPWGISGVQVGNVAGSLWNPIRSYANYHNGLEATQIVLKPLSGVNPISSVKLYNDEKPQSAFHYCYGKNKRNADGSVPDNLPGYWNLPGISDLELALVEYYPLFHEFQGNYYWSASAAEASSGVGAAKEDSYRARATKVNIVNGVANYVESGYGQNYPEYGNAPRTQVLRIRAAYKFK